jgi:hypothetical protein
MIFEKNQDSKEYQKIFRSCKEYVRNFGSLNKNQEFLEFIKNISAIQKIQEFLENLNFFRNSQEF